jgi:hypothetical protein
VGNSAHPLEKFDMKTKNLFLLAALIAGFGLITAGQVRAQLFTSILLDGDFNSLAPGTAPDVGVPAGHWSFPPDYAGVDEFTNAFELSIAVAPGGTNGNSLHVLADSTIINNQHLPNMFTQSVNKGTGAWLIATFDLYVATGHGGGSAYLGNGWAASSNRGPQIAWDPAGNMVYTAPNGSMTNFIGAYAHGIWQSVRIEADIDNDRYNFYAGPRGIPFSVISSNLPFRSGPLPFIDRFTIARFDSRPDVDSYFDNIVVRLAPASAPQLTITRSGANVVLMWPTNATGFGLQSTTNLVSPAVWSTNFPAPVIVNGQSTVTNPITGPSQYFRLVQ